LHISSFNYTRIASDSNSENILIVTQPALAAQYSAHFAYLRSKPTAPFPQAPWNPPREGVWAHALFFPSEVAFKSLLSVINATTRSLDIAVYNFTDDQLVSALSSLSKRGVRVRLLTDTEQAKGTGSDAQRLGGLGVEVKMTGSKQAMMHHKFAVMDGRVLLTGRFVLGRRELCRLCLTDFLISSSTLNLPIPRSLSRSSLARSFNWTKAARYNNHENVLVTNAMDAVTAYGAEFEKLWRSV
jgi:phosphatidylserine/phosphatidylglycerophosphate/cardiolipin synthase-like enzyme